MKINKPYKAKYYFQYKHDSSKCSDCKKNSCQYVEGYETMRSHYQEYETGEPIVFDRADIEDTNITFYSVIKTDYYEFTTIPIEYFDQSEIDNLNKIVKGSSMSYTAENYIEFIEINRFDKVSPVGLEMIAKEFRSMQEQIHSLLQNQVTLPHESQIEAAIDKLMVIRGDHPSKIRNPIYSEERTLTKDVVKYVLLNQDK